MPFPLFSPLYRRTMTWARHRHAVWYLGVLSFAESSFFPIPPDVMLAPMALAQPHLAWRLAALTTVSSVLGGLFGYLIGWLLFEVVTPWLHYWNYWEVYLTARQWFDQWGFWAIFIAGFSPIPYKMFTIAAGTVTMALMPFILASLIGRGLRFFLVAGLMRWGGATLEASLHTYIDRLGWLTVLIVWLLYVGLQL